MIEALADIVVIVHLACFLFVVGGFTGIPIGLAGRRTWICNPWFRSIHFISVMVVPAEDVIGFRCPLNVLENALRSRSAGASVTSSGIGDVLDSLLRHTIPGPVLDRMYWVIGAALLVLLFIARPRLATRSGGIDRAIS